VDADGSNARKDASVAVNVLLITLDQFRGDCLSAAGHPLVRTPNLDRLTEGGVRFARHYSQAAPCAPGRACLYTGMYQMNNRVVGNGTPLDARFDNVALAARRAGYRPVLFGYTDQAADPRTVNRRDDPTLATWEGVLPGFDLELDLRDEHLPWLAWLDERGYDISPGCEALLATERDRPAAHSLSTFVTDHIVAWIERQDAPWFAHVSYWRPHPPYCAAGDWAKAYSPADVELPIAPSAHRHPTHDFALGLPEAAAPHDEAGQREMRAQYFGMISEVDDQLGRVWEALVRTGQDDDTVIAVVSDHGEMLGDHGLKEKLGYWEQSYYVLGIIRDPRHPEAHGSVIESFTENVDVMPTLCEAMGVGVPVQCDGFPLTPFLRAAEPPRWRDAAHWEYDWRAVSIATTPHQWPWDRKLERQHLAVLRQDRLAYVQFGDRSWLCFDLVADPTWRTEIHDADAVLPLAQDMLVWRSRHTDRTLADCLVGPEAGGRWPAALATAATI
jgi:arylsulfatase A-like enzyme